MLSVSRLAACVVLLLIVPWLSACDPAEHGRVTLEFWAFGREGEMVQELVRGFERDHPGIAVEVQQIPWSAAHEKLLTAFAGDTMPDVVQLGNTWIPEFVALGALVDLAPLVAAAEAVDAEAFFPGVWAANRVGAGVWGLPWYVDTRLLYYRTDILRRAGCGTVPRTWEDWVSCLRRTRDLQAGPRHALFLPITDWTLPVALAMQQGASPLADGNRFGNFDSPAGHAAFDFYLGLFEKGLAPKTGSAEIANVYQEFAAGAFAMFVSGPWSIGELDRRLPGLRGLWATAPLPASDADAWPGTSIAGGASLAISRNSEHPDAAWALISHLADTTRQLRFYALTGNLPSRREAWVAGKLSDEARTAAFSAQLSAMSPPPRVPEWERIAAAIGRHTEAMILGRMERDEALVSLDAEIDRILEKRRWLIGRGRLGS